MNISNKVMLGDIPKLCLLVATLALGSAAGGSRLCERGRSWWNRDLGACVPCTFCDSKLLAVKRPCDLRGDTICQPLHEVRIELFHKNDDSALSEYVDFDEKLNGEYDYAYGEVNDGEGMKWNVQTTTLALAACGCVIFFVVVLYLTFHHGKQWKALKQALRSDVQDLSAKLKLMEAGDTPAEPAVPATHHIYCNINVAKDALLGPASKKKGLGNVYTQEKHSS